MLPVCVCVCVTGPGRDAGPSPPPAHQAPPRGQEGPPHHPLTRRHWQESIGEEAGGKRYASPSVCVSRWNAYLVC